MLLGADRSKALAAKAGCVARACQPRRMIDGCKARRDGANAEVMEDWNARQYLKFEDERTRPPRDLLAQVPLRYPRLVFDLGCGPGNSTELLVGRYPEAEVIGLDSSPDMLRKARERLPQCTFVEADIASWSVPPRTDLLFANASFQWIPDHPRVLRRLLGSAAVGRRARGADARQHARAVACSAARGGGKRPVGEQSGNQGGAARRSAVARGILRSARTGLLADRHLAHHLSIT